MSENKYSLICSSFTGTLNQLHFILFIHLSSHFIFQFLHVVSREYACLLACLVFSGRLPVNAIPLAWAGSYVVSADVSVQCLFIEWQLV